jgi:hypothetical protein
VLVMGAVGLLLLLAAREASIIGSCTSSNMRRIALKPSGWFSSYVKCPCKVDGLGVGTACAYLAHGDVLVTHSLPHGIRVAHHLQGLP